MIVCGEIHGEAEKQQIIALAEMLQFPILADPLSNLRNGEHDKTLIIDAYDNFAADDHTSFGPRETLCNMTERILIS